VVGWLFSRSTHPPPHCSHVTSFATTSRVQLPAFYKAYVTEVQHIIDANARLEFEAINREHARTGIPRSQVGERAACGHSHRQLEVLLPCFSLVGMPQVVLGNGAGMRGRPLPRPCV
jgi:hypothetical protein